MMIDWHRLGFLALLGAGAVSSSALAQSPLPPKWGAHLDLEGKLGNQRALGEGDLFVPLLQDGKSMLFANIKARMDDDASSEGNYGLGVRHMLDAGWNLGAYGFFDRRRTEHANYFNQVTFGAEALSLNWDFRANLYLPEGRRSHPVESLNEAYITGTNVYFRGGEERSLGGFDAEIGYRVPVFEANADRQLRLFAGGYRFTSDDPGVSDVQGPRGRVEYTMNEVEWLWQGSRLSVGGEVQDDVRGNQMFLSARLRVPLQIFGAGRRVASLTPLERRMTDPVIRDIDVVAQAGAFGPQETVTQTTSGGAVKVITSATTTGANLNSEMTAAGANSTVILSGTFATTAQYSMQAGQTLMGNGSVAVRSPSGRVAVLNTNTSGTISGTDVAGGILQANGSATVTGLTLTAAYSAGSGGVVLLIAGGADNVKILNNTITNTQSGASGGAAVSSGGGGANTNVLIQGNTITMTGSGAATATSALRLNGTHASTYTIQGNTISASGAPINTMVDLGSVGSTINAGSTDNIRGGGPCTGTVGSGSIIFTNGTTCP